MTQCGKGVSCQGPPIPGERFRQVIKPSHIAHSTCAWVTRIQSIFKGKVNFKNDLLFVGLKIKLEVEKQLEFSQIKSLSFVINVFDGIFKLDTITSIACYVHTGNQPSVCFGVKPTASLGQEMWILVESKKKTWPHGKLASSFSKAAFMLVGFCSCPESVTKFPDEVEHLPGASSRSHTEQGHALSSGWNCWMELAAEPQLAGWPRSHCSTSLGLSLPQSVKQGAWATWSLTILLSLKF